MLSSLSKYRIILASQSKIRGDLLLAHLAPLGLGFETVPSEIDESSIKNATQYSYQEKAVNLAMNKAEVVYTQVRNAKEKEKTQDVIIIAADQLCVLGDLILDKPMTPANAIRQLSKLNGKTHELISATIVTLNGNLLWRYQDKAVLTMKTLTDSEIKSYVEKDHPIYSCGAYYYEKNGASLFENVEGTKDAILGFSCGELFRYFED